MVVVVVVVVWPWWWCGRGGVARATHDVSNRLPGGVEHASVWAADLDVVGLVAAVVGEALEEVVAGVAHCTQ